MSLSAQKAGLGQRLAETSARSRVAGQWSFYDPVPDPERRETGRSLLKALQSDSSEPPLVRLGVVRLPPSWAALEAALSASPDRLKRTLRLHLSPR